MGGEARLKGVKEKERAGREEKVGIENRFGARRTEDRKKGMLK